MNYSSAHKHSYLNEQHSINPKPNPISYHTEYRPPTMAEPDELYTLHAQYWLGLYSLAFDEGVPPPAVPCLRI
jgi:hypothetical protein